MTDNMQGIFYSLFSVLLFAIVASMAKVAINEYHVLQILFFRQVIVFISTLPSLKTSFPQVLKTKHPTLHALRLLGALLALTFAIWTLEYLPLATAITLGFTEVFFASFLAIYFLGEKFTIHKVLASFLGFIGVVIIVNPTLSSLNNVFILVPILSAFGASIAFICVKKLSKTESTATLLAYQSIFIGLFCAISLFWLWKTPNLEDFILLLSMGIMATLANWTSIKAIKLSDAITIANIKYFQVIFAMILGYFIFNESPNALSILGSIIIILSSIYITVSSRKNKKNLKINKSR